MKLIVQSQSISIILLENFTFKFKIETIIVSETFAILNMEKYFLKTTIIILRKISKSIKSIKVEINK